MVDFLTSTEFWFNAIFAFVDIFFGVMLWIVDRRSKKRQEETLTKQEESLDIILDQVSKVNHYQTRVLSYAIETLEQDLNDMKQMINTGIKTQVEAEAEITPKIAEIESESATIPSLGDSIGSHFNKILRNQLSGIMDSVQKSLGETQKTTEEKSYKAKKGLEFDLKHVLRGLDELQNLGKPKSKPDLTKEEISEMKKKRRELKREKQEKRRKKKEFAKKEAQIPDLPEEPVENEKVRVDRTENDMETSEREILTPFDQKELKIGLDTISDLGQDIASFTNSILESVVKAIPQDASRDLETEIDELKKRLEEKKRQRLEEKKKRAELRRKKWEERIKEIEE
ncbi:MAG: hypothetical protein ACFFDT_10540 [Candidatus Hodarchaeota archaeon]